MLAAHKVIIAVNVICSIAIVLIALVFGGGVASDILAPAQGHEIKLIPVRNQTVVAHHARVIPVQRAEIPSAYLIPDPQRARWVVLNEGAVQFDRRD